ncbi:MAG TPA: tRNA lysidine(34) synthetase TilS, partial [Anaerolineales bacterium]|nr:tRNA lysidine(34) synthetase TilS [Anaerolineales bacterium]
MSAMFVLLDVFAKNACGLVPNRPIVVGVSGGPDSLCLLDALHRLKYPVIAAHFNHHLREDAHADAVFVQDTAARMGIPFAGGEGDVTEFSRARGFSIEEAARALRYPFLFAQARRFNAQAVAVGHNADDQAETVLFAVGLACILLMV